ncbi:hypothetical protein HaLaN_24174 [Haematococcus lacustris]|uniref:Uncharacterized protein n=1 Tax=Haematococcus lacustris TaxID=44745 RepID=A0A699ZT97_HAELA|nr:hypothetical protein HaLaN_24174 [Haematococcus lacustris]
MDIYGAMVMSKVGALLWSGWRKEMALPIQQLCKTISDIFNNTLETQDSSYLEADSFVAASTADTDNFIVTIICSCGYPETEVLLKARELSHAIKLLFGMHISSLGRQQAAQLSAGQPDLLLMLQSRSPGHVCGLLQLL